MQLFIETDRLILREITADDAPAMFDLDSDPEVHRYLGNQPVRHIQEIETIIAHIRRQYAENGIGRWAVVDKETGEFAGWSGLKYETNTHTGARYHDLGYRLRRKYWGRGIATESAAAVLKYGFETLGIGEVFANAHENNAASNRILSKLGFRLQERILYESAWDNWYRLLRSEWAAK